MYVDFDDLPPSSRVWIYQADRFLSTDEKAQIVHELKHFVDIWTAHQAPLQGAVKIEYQRFLILAVNEKFNEASGCSIDASVHAIQAIEKKFHVRFLDRAALLFLHEDLLREVPLTDIKSLIEDNTINENTIIFNPQVANKEGLDNFWLIPAQNSWLSKYFKQ